MSNIIQSVQPSSQSALGLYSTATLSNSRQIAFVERDASQIVATVAGPPQVTASGETVAEATARLESRVSLYA